MTDNKSKKGQAKRAVEFLTMFFSLVLIVSGFAFFMDATSSAKNNGASKYSSIPRLLASQKDSMISNDGIWQKADKNKLGNLTPSVNIKSGKSHIVQLNENILTDLLSGVAVENTQRAATDFQIITLPMPDGSFARFKILESPIMESGLASEFSNIKTYAGYNIDDPSAYVRFDITSFGFHGMIRSTEGLVLIDPYTDSTTIAKKSDSYISYYRKDISDIKRDTQCLFKGKDIDISDLKTDESISTRNLVNNGNNTFNLSSGPTLRTYRLAVSTTGEFAQFYGGTIDGAMNGLVTVVNRVNGVYEMELGVRMVLVNNNSQLIFTNPATDGFTNNNGGVLLGENQSKIDTIIGNANYDIGHVFSTGGGGIAGLGVICTTGQKARGVTGLPSPIGDAFAIDFVAHEMGHQFGGNHTFNGTTSSCGGGNRSTNNAYEPGSGSTIMAYAGICGAENLQNNSDPYFHGRSFDEIITRITNTSCAAQSSTGNGTPLVNAGADFTIPQGTPFTLTPASASDPDNDPLTYCWEEFDLGAASPPNTDNGNRPIFRSFNPTTNPSRTFPRLSNILSNTSTLGESLPTTTRTMNFRLTVRDNRAGGGGVNNDAVQVSVVSTAGPFAITQPNTGTFTGGGSLTVVWNVANTNIAPINTANVKISLSTDGGNTFPTVLADNTPNDGSQSVTLPNIQTTSARVKVEAVGNIFFDISNSNFTIQTGTNCTFTISPTSASVGAAATTGSITVTASDPSCSRTATSNDAFITVTSGASGTGSGTVGYSVAANSSTSPRTGTITVAGQTFTVNQAGNSNPPPTCTFTVSPTTASIGLSGGTGSITVTASDPSCARTATSNSAFITITSGASGTGSGTVTYSVATAKGNRTGTLTVAGQTVTINQTNNPGPTCTFSISPTSASVGAAATTGSITVTASDPSCSRTATSNDAFITVTSGASGTGSGTVGYSVAANSSTSPRTGTITVAGQTFTVNQAGASGPTCTFSISPTSASVGAAATTGSITVTASDPSCARTATSNSAFITITSGASGTGSGTVGYSVAANSSTSPRTGTITVAGQTFTVNQAGAAAPPPCTFTVSPTSASFGLSGGTGTVTVTASDPSCARTAVSNSPFITITSGASGTGSGTVTYSVSLSKTARTGTITVAGQTITITQSATNRGGQIF